MHDTVQTTRGKKTAVSPGAELSRLQAGEFQHGLTR